jgi:hypothetical protein
VSSCQTADILGRAVFHGDISGIAEAERARRSFGSAAS